MPTAPTPERTPGVRRSAESLRSGRQGGGAGEERPAGLAVWRASLGWTAGLLLVAQLYLAATGTPLGGDEVSTWRFLFLLLGQLGLLIPFTTFAGGVAVGPPVTARRLRTVAVAAAGLALVAWTVSAVAAPLADHRAELARGADPPFGAATPAGLARQRRWVEANPPAGYSFSVERPFQLPPNWLSHRMHVPVVLSLFAVLNAVLGLLAAGATAGLSPPARRQARWAIGLLGAVAFLVALAAADGWVRSSVSVPGPPAAWLTLAVPVAEGVLLALFVRRARRPLHASEAGRVS